MRKEVDGLFGVIMSNCLGGRATAAMAIYQQAPLFLCPSWNDFYLEIVTWLCIAVGGYERVCINSDGGSAGELFPVYRKERGKNAAHI